MVAWQAARYRRVLDNLPDLICCYLPDGTITYVNRTYSDYIGKPAQELIGQNITLVMPEIASNSLATPIVANVAQSEDDYHGVHIATYNCQIIAADGSMYWLEWTDQAMYNERGELVELQGVGRNITSYKHTEALLYQMNQWLECQIQDHITQLHRALQFEALLRRITDRVRDSLDEHQILQTAVQELAVGLGVLCCDTALYDLEKRTSTICYEYAGTSFMSAIGSVISLDSNPDLFQQVFKGWSTQCCFVKNSRDLVRPQAQQCTILICPLHDDQGLLGDMWLFRPMTSCFTAAEIRLVEQVAIQCAIALRQSRLYQASQAQLQEFARLNRLKDDFLSTVSHELRTPMASIKMAVQMLDVALSNQQLSLTHQQPILRYLKILKDECRREISLINDLLDLARLDSGDKPLLLVPIDLYPVFDRLVARFAERIHSQHQHLVLDIAPTLPVVKTDLSYLERILNELLTNACKYTPAGELIRISCLATTTPAAEVPFQTANDVHHAICRPVVQIAITNMGAEIAPEELPRIFDKFYRIPDSDPWKHGGTGLGLALVQKLATHLKAAISVSSGANQTTFTLVLFSVLETDTRRGD